NRNLSGAEKRRFEKRQMHEDQICRPDGSETGKETCARACELAQVCPMRRQIEPHEIWQNELSVQIRRREEEVEQIAKAKALTAPQIRRTWAMNN
ncbi:MAG TPA: hypothetical protein VGO51_09275, partial [Burkholderiaceae bacterium]|nr:hypothetical protein [Burkholderiaceae bacterium]